MDSLNLKIIARIKSDFPEKFGIPRQSGLVPSLRSVIRFEPEFRNADALRGLEGFSHLWLIWIFSENVRGTWHPTVRPPRLGGNTRLGVFATRSSFRPNPIAMSCVKIEGIRLDAPDGPEIIVSGADLMDGKRPRSEGRICGSAPVRLPTGGNLPRNCTPGTGRQVRCPRRNFAAGPAPALPGRPRKDLRAILRQQEHQVQGCGQHAHRHRRRIKNTRGKQPPRAHSHPDIILAYLICTFCMERTEPTWTDSM